MVRTSGGGGGRERFLQQTLLRRIDSCKSRFSTADDIVDHLRSTYSSYHRMKFQTLLFSVRKALLASNNNQASYHSRRRRRNDDSDDDDSEDDDHDHERYSSRKRRRNDESQNDDSENDHEIMSTQTSSDYSYRNRHRIDDFGSGSDDDHDHERIRNVSLRAIEIDEYNSEDDDADDDDLGRMRYGRMNTGASSNYDSENYIKKVEESDVLRKSSIPNAASGVGSSSDVKKGPMFKDLAGNRMEKIKKELEVPLNLLCYPELGKKLGLEPLTGILLHGPPGCGKTRLAHAIANETELPFYPISATDVVSGVTGGSEENIRELFSKAKRTAPSIIFIDEIDAIASKRENSQRQTETRIVTQLLTCMEEACNSVNSDEPTGYVLVIGATNRLDAIDSALRRPGRFAREILVGIPDESAREEILFVHTRKRSDKFDASVDLQKIAGATPGFVGADLEALVGKAGELALERIINERNRESSKDLMSEPNIVRWKKTWSPQEINKFAIKMSDFEEAIKMVQPSLTREGFSPIPDVKWEDVGALDDARENFDSNILMRIKEPEIYEGLGLDHDTGFLLYGPPGCGKTLIAKAVANEAGANFIYIKGPELLNKYVGESEREVRKLFDRARACAPCILFFDEVDALTSKHGNEGSRVIDGVLKQLLIELEGAEQRKGVFVIGATNRPLEMDKAVLRPGRFGNHIYISLPSPDGRVSILKALARSKEALARRKETHARFKLMPIDASVDLSAIGRSKACENYSGADLAALMDKAILAALEEKLATTARTSDTLTVERKHFYVALTKVRPSVSEKQMKYYDRVSKKLKGGDVDLQ